MYTHSSQLKKLLCIVWARFCNVSFYRLSRGDTEIAFSLQSTVKPLIYGFVLNDLSPEVVHKYVGQEPSGRSFNELTLDYQSK